MFNRLTYTSAGESHGPGVTMILSGIPAGLKFDVAFFEYELEKRNLDMGRGKRGAIEQNAYMLTGGVRHGITIGSPISIYFPNADYANWQQRMDPLLKPERITPITTPRPGHADFVGSVKYGFRDMRNALERASARETLARVAAGAIAQMLLKKCGCDVAAYVSYLGDKAYREPPVGMHPSDIRSKTQANIGYVFDIGELPRMQQQIDRARDAGTTLGGQLKFVLWGCPVGLGSYTDIQNRLDARLAMALMSIPSVKGVVLGAAIEQSRLHGSKTQDIVTAESSKTHHIYQSNMNGGLTAGVTNGLPLTGSIFLKPLSTQRKALRSIDADGHLKTAHKERSDVSAVGRATTVVSAMVALVVLDAVLEKFGGDAVTEIEQRLDSWRKAHPVIELRPDA